jgi:hypothetical protein
VLLDTPCDVLLALTREDVPSFARFHPARVSFGEGRACGPRPFKLSRC